MVRHPVQRSSNSSVSRLSANIRSICGRSKQSSPSPGQYTPLPYVLSIDVVILASSAWSAGSAGAASPIDVFSSSSLRRVSAGNATPSKRAASVASSIVAPMTTVCALAAMAVVSPVMKLLCTHAARPASIHSSSRRASASSTNTRASSAVGPGSAHPVTSIAMTRPTRGGILPVVTCRMRALLRSSGLYPVCETAFTRDI